MTPAPCLCLFCVPDNVEWNVQEAHARAEHGVKHLEQATKYQKSYRKSVSSASPPPFPPSALVATKELTLCFPFSLPHTTAVLYYLLHRRSCSCHHSLPGAETIDKKEPSKQQHQQHEQQTKKQTKPPKRHGLDSSKLTKRRV